MHPTFLRHHRIINILLLAALGAGYLLLPSPVQVKASTLAGPQNSPANNPIISLDGSSQGQVLDVHLPDGFVKQSLAALKIYLPPGYNTQTQRRYPVLYLLHGQDDSDEQWVRLGVNTVADRLIASGEIKPMIIVMPGEAGSPAPENTGFGAALATSLVPWIDANYRTLPDRNDRAIGGLSRGAAWAVRLGLIYWQTFGAIGANSFPMFYGDNYLIPGWLDAIPIDSYPHIYLDIGNSDPELQLVKMFEDYLTRRGIPHEYHLNVGYHEDKYWQAHLEDYLLWYNSTW